MKRSFLVAGAAFAASSLAACNQSPQGAANVATEGGATQIASGVTAGSQPPPPIPDYPQPPAPGPGYEWTPGYWGWNGSDNNYYWAPGSWTQPPQSGLLWTPGYWAWSNGVYAFTGGHWGHRVGFYGGVNYGNGYGGSGYQGGEWRGDRFFYNRAANNVGQVTDVYTRPVPPAPHNRLSYNGGPGGVKAAPTPEERAEIQAPHVAPTVEQAQREHQAVTEPRLRANQVAKGGGADAVSEIQRRPPVAAEARPTVERQVSQLARPESRPPAEQMRPESRPAAMAPRPEAAPPRPEARPPARPAEPARGQDDRKPGPG